MSESKMEYRYLGNSGLRVSALSLGAGFNWGVHISDDVAYECMKAAFDAGCIFFDNAESYASGKAEETMGKAIKRLNVERSELVISTKVFWGKKGVNQSGLPRKHIIEGLNDSLKRLDLDYVDLFFCHRPDYDTPIEEIVRACNHVIEKGKAFYWGTSEWPADYVTAAVEIAKRLGLIGPIMEQPQYNMLHRTRVEKEYSRLYSEYKLGTTTWSPLASGLLTGKYNSLTELPKESRFSDEKYKWMASQLASGQSMNGLEERNFDAILEKVSGLAPIAKKLDCSLAQLALAWCLKNPNVSTVITGASKVEQVKENFKALEVVPKLTPEVMEEIEQVLKNKPEPYQVWK